MAFNAQNLASLMVKTVETEHFANLQNREPNGNQDCVICVSEIPLCLC